eukprot:SAG11_NODE_34676_length_270_cov_1.497076_1_plen_47_part_10
MVRGCRVEGDLQTRTELRMLGDNFSDVLSIKIVFISALHPLGKFDAK